VWDGINDWLAAGLMTGSKASVVPLKGDIPGPDGTSEGGQGRLVKFADPVDMSRLEELIKQHTCVPQLQVAYGHTRAVETVAICAGSGGSMLLGADADLYWTGEMSHLTARSTCCCRGRKECGPMWPYEYRKRISSPPCP